MHTEICLTPARESVNKSTAGRQRRAGLRKRGADETRECIAVNTWTERDSVCLSEHLLITSREPGSSRCLAPTAGAVLLTVDKQVGVGMGWFEKKRKALVRVDVFP